MILKKNDITKQVKNFTTNLSLIEICPIDKSVLVLSFISSTSLFCFLECEFIALVFIIIYVGAIAVLFLFVIMMLDGNLRKGGEAAFWAPFFSKDDYKLIEKAMRTCYAEEDSESIADFKASAPKTMAEISETLQNARRSLDCKLKITSEEIPNVSPEIIRKDREIDQNIDTLIQRLVKLKQVNNSFSVFQINISKILFFLIYGIVMIVLL